MREQEERKIREDKKRVEKEREETKAKEREARRQKEGKEQEQLKKRGSLKKGIGKHLTMKPVAEQLSSCKKTRATHFNLPPKDAEVRAWMSWVVVGVVANLEGLT